MKKEKLTYKERREGKEKMTEEEKREIGENV
jgi:hypothetical protein